MNFVWIFYENLLFFHMKSFEMSLLFKNTVCWNFFNLLFPLFPPLEVLHSVNICCRLPSLFLPSGRCWCSYPVLKNGTVKVWEGRNPKQQSAVLSRLHLETVPSVLQYVRKCVTARHRTELLHGRRRGFDPVTQFCILDAYWKRSQSSC